MLEGILLRLKLWSFLVLPAAGFVTGQILQYVLGTKHNPKFETLFVHLITVTFMTMLFADISLNSNVIVDIRDRVLLLGISYLFVLGTVIGIISYVI